MDRRLARSLAWSVTGILYSVMAQGGFAAAPASDERIPPPAGLTQRTAEQHLAELRQQRIALVIGAANYDHARPPLRNPLNDAEGVADLLERFGFTVMKKLDPDLEELHDALDEFESGARGYKTALIYFAGHGVEYREENYLIPVDAELKKSRHLGHEAVALRTLFDVVEAARVSSAVVMLDACRNNPFPLEDNGTPRGTGGGLAELEAPTDFLIAYATEPGDTADDGDGSNGVFTTAFLQHADSPGAPVRDVLDKVARTVAELTNGDQRPWKHDNMTRTIVLRYPFGELDFDHYMWAVAQRVADDNVLPSFKIQGMAQYLCYLPQGVHVDDAIAAIDELKENVSNFSIGDYCSYRPSAWLQPDDTEAASQEQIGMPSATTISFSGAMHRDPASRTLVNYAIVPTSSELEAVSTGDLRVSAAAPAQWLNAELWAEISDRPLEGRGIVLESYAPDLSNADPWDQRKADLSAALSGLIALHTVATTPEFREASAELAAPRISLATRRISLLGAEVIGEGGARIAEIEDIVRSPQDDQLYAVMETGGFLGIGSRQVAIPLDAVNVGPNREIVLEQSAEDSLLAVAPYEEDMYQPLEQYQ